MSSNTEIWARLRQIETLRFTSKSHTGIGWGGAGSGIVEVTQPTPETLVFREFGLWKQDAGRELRFSNVFRWTLLEDRMRLEHLRFGPDNPVFLFDMTLGSAGIWREISAHPCREDCYRASLRVEDGQVFVSWRVQGPDRNEIIDYVYL